MEENLDISKAAMNEETKQYFAERDAKSEEMTKKVQAALAKRDQCEFLTLYIAAAKLADHHVVNIEELIATRPGEPQNPKLEEIKKKYIAFLETTNIEFMRQYGRDIPSDILARNFAFLTTTPEIPPAVTQYMKL